MEDTSKEYLMLRNEMLKGYEIIQNSRNILYVVVASILSFSISENEALLFLIPYIVIIPIYLISIDYTLDMFRIGTYLMIFHEINTFRWENRQYSFNHIIINKVPRRSQWFHIPFIFSSIVCIALYFLFLPEPLSIYTISKKYFISTVVALILFGTVIAIFFKYRHMEDIQKKYINSWNEVKIRECENSNNLIN